ncbi:hypothetical protein Plec18170_009778 [Paecilomyces lecythidis]
MAHRRPSQTRISSAEQKRKRQKRNRRLKTIFKKVYEFNIACESNVFFGVQMKDTGRISIFNADSSGIWSSAISSLESYYPVPDKKTPVDFISLSKIPKGLEIVPASAPVNPIKEKEGECYSNQSNIITQSLL